MSEPSAIDLLRDLFNRIYDASTNMQDSDVKNIFDVLNDAAGYLQTEFDCSFPTSQKEWFADNQPQAIVTPQPQSDVFESQSSAIPSVADDSELEQAFARFYYIEHVLSDRLYQLGKGAEDIFIKYDSAPRTGTISLSNLRVVFLDLGVPFTDLELEFVQAKAPVTYEGAEIHDLVSWRAYMGYLEKLRSTDIPSDLKQDAATTLMRRLFDLSHAKPANGQNSNAHNNSKAPYATETESTMMLSSTQRIDSALRRMREHMHARSIPLPMLFRQLKNNQDTVSLERLLQELPNQGFPSHQCSDDEIRAYCLVMLSNFAPNKNDTQKENLSMSNLSLNYAQFTQFFRGKGEADEISREENSSLSLGRPLLSEQTLVQALVKLNSLPIRAHHRELDIENNRAVSFTAIIDDLLHLGLSKAVAESTELLNLLQSYSKRSPQALTLEEYTEFVNVRVGSLQPPRPLLNVSIPDDVTGPQAIHAIRKATMHGVDLLSIFGEFAPLNSSRIMEQDLWHAFGSIGISVPKPVLNAVFQLFDPIEEAIVDFELVSPVDVDGTSSATHEMVDIADIDPSKPYKKFRKMPKVVRTVDYEEVATTISRPHIHPRVGLSQGVACRVTHAESTVPLGATIERLRNELSQTEIAISESRKANSGARSLHSHRFDDHEMTADEMASQQKHDDPARRATRNISNVSAIQFGEENTPHPSELNRQQTKKFASQIEFGDNNMPLAGDGFARQGPVRGISSIGKLLDHETNIAEDTVTSATLAEEFAKRSNDFANGHGHGHEHEHKDLHARLLARMAVTGMPSTNVLAGEGALSISRPPRKEGTKILSVPNQSSFTMVHQYSDETAEDDIINSSNEIFGSHRRHVTPSYGLQTQTTASGPPPSGKPSGPVNTHSLISHDFSGIGSDAEHTKSNKRTFHNATRSSISFGLTTEEFERQRAEEDGVMYNPSPSSHSQLGGVGVKGPRSSAQHSSMGSIIGMDEFHQQAAHQQAENMNNLTNTPFAVPASTDVIINQTALDQEQVEVIQESALEKLKRKYGLVDASTLSSSPSPSPSSSSNGPFTQDSGQYPLDEQKITPEETMAMYPQQSQSQPQLPVDTTIMNDNDTDDAEILEHITMLSRLVFASGRSKELFSRWSHGAKTLSYINFHQGARQVGSTIPDETLEQIFARYDKHGGRGALSFGQFMEMLSTVEM